MNDRTMSEGLEKRQLLMIGALGFVLLALVYFLFLRGGGAEEPQEASQPDPAPIAQAGSEDPFEPEQGNGNTSQPVETFEVFASRDPFEPVVGNGSQGGADDGDTGGAGDAQGDGDDPGSSGGTDPGSQEPRQEEDGVAGLSVSLIDVFREGGTDKAQVRVDSTGYTVTPGEVFAENFQLVSASGTCATLLYGDDQFTLCEGEQILK